MQIKMEPYSALGSGPVEDRYPLKPQPPLPWYYDQTKATAAALVAIAIIIIIAFGNWI